MAKSHTNGPNKSLARATLLRMASRLSLVILFTSTVAYLHLFTTIERGVMGQLENYARERGFRERQLFALALNNHAVLKKRILEELA